MLLKGLICWYGFWKCLFHPECWLSIVVIIWKCVKTRLCTKHVETYQIHVRFQVLAVMSLKMVAFRDIAPCGLWNVDLLQRDYAVQYPRSLSSSYQIQFGAMGRNEQPVEMSYFVVEFTGDCNVDSHFCILEFILTFIISRLFWTLYRRWTEVIYHNWMLIAWFFLYININISIIREFYCLISFP
jgi:hypothetical protein